jgi:1-acyl-sn-glycerol-3-phosphate acyltransferase
LLKAWVKFGLRIFYRDIEVHGADRIPADAPVLFAVNHPNTLLDALLTCCYTPLQPWFLARGDVFANKRLAKIFAFMRMLPVFRERDGRERVKANGDIFTLCSDILARDGALIMFPEGSHNRQWRIRDLRKGLSRIAGETWAQGKNIYIVPAGINYSDPLHGFSDVLINFGEPILAGPFFEGSKTMVQKQAKLTEAVGIALEKLTLHISHPDYEGISRKIADMSLVSVPAASHMENLTRRQAWVKSLEQLRKPEFETAEPLRRADMTWHIIALVLTLPFWAIGKMAALIPLFVSALLTRKIKDDHFHAAVKFVSGLLLNTLLATALLVYLLVTEYVWFWAIARWVFICFCRYFVMLWEEKFRFVMAVLRPAR